MTATKILKEDLDIDVRVILKQVEDSKGGSADLPARLTTIEKSATGLGSEVAEVSQDVGAIQIEVKAAEQDIANLKTGFGMVSEEGSFNEVYTYDGSGNVTKQTVTGDQLYVVNYVYADAVNGTLNYSEKIYISDGKSVKIKKTYTYDSSTGNITGVATVTTKTPITP